MKEGKIKKESAALLIIDIQEGLVPVIPNHEKLISNTNKLIKGAQIFNVPVIISEQYPKGLKKTCKEIFLPPGIQMFEKNSFSCFLCEGISNQLNELKIKSLILAGIEAHICVLKTALDALENGFDVHVVADAIASRTFENRNLAIERMRQSGAFISSTEMILFQMIDSSKSEDFKFISAIIK